MKDIQILKLFIRNKDLYNKFIEDINNIILEREIQLLLNTIKEYYNKYLEHEYIGKEEFINFFKMLYPTIKDYDVYIAIIDNIYSIEVSDSLIKDYILQLIEKDFSNRIINKLLPVLEDSKANILLTIEDDINKYKSILQHKTEESSVFVEDDLDSLIESEVTADGLNWRLKCLQEDVGMLRGGNLIHIMARPETGKTSFLCSEVANFARQLKDDECIIWFNNEEKGKKVKLRLYSAILNSEISDIVTNASAASEYYKKYKGDKIKLYDNAFISIEEICRMCVTYNPRLIIVDQGDKISFSGDKKLEIVERLKALYVKFREVAKQYNCDIITVGQASAEAHGKKWVDFNHMDFSKTGKAGEMDLIIGIGKTCEETDSEVRYLNICKNKATGKHTRHAVLLDARKARYTDFE